MIKKTLLFLIAALLASNCNAMSAHYEEEQGGGYTHSGDGISQFDIISLEDDGLSKMKRGDFHGAISNFKKVMKHDSARIKTLNGIGFSYAMLGNPSAAAGFFARAMHAAGNEPAMYNEISLYLAAIGNSDDGLALAQRVYASNKSVVFKEDLANNLAFMFAVSGNSKKAIQIAEKYSNSARMKMAGPYFEKLAEDEEFAQEEIFSRLGMDDSIAKRQVALNLKNTIQGLQVSKPQKRTIKHKSKDAYNDLW